MIDVLRRTYHDYLFQYLLEPSQINAERLAAASLTLHLYENQVRYNALHDHQILSIIRGFKRSQLGSERH